MFFPWSPLYQKCKWVWSLACFIQYRRSLSSDRKSDRFASLLNLQRQKRTRRRLSLFTFKSTQRTNGKVSTKHEQPYAITTLSRPLHGLFFNSREEILYDRLIWQNFYPSQFDPSMLMHEARDSVISSSIRTNNSIWQRRDFCIETVG